MLAAPSPFLLFNANPDFREFVDFLHANSILAHA
jgi:hypothetical protein